MKDKLIENIQKKLASADKSKAIPFTLDEATELGAFNEDSVTEAEAIEASKGGDDEKE